MPKLACSLILLLSLSVAHAADEVLTPDQINDGWIALFDGETLFGWEATNDANWRVEDGAIMVDSGAEGWLMTTSEFDGYDLHVEFQGPATTNSGVFLRTPLTPTDPAKDCYEVNIAPADNPFPTGSLVARIKSAGPASAGLQGWNTLEITAQGSTIKIVLNDTEVTSYDDPHPLARGHIGLQFREGPIYFRNIRLKPLGLKPIFNGRNLTGWNTDRADQSEFSVDAEGELTVKNGPGQLESDDQFGDFLLQLECKVNVDGINSGIFFRCIPGDLMMGYESQIHNAMLDGDPTQPVDCGTGGIFRRQNARRIVARDHEWFAKTIVATGPHMAVWVNGYQVSDWTDDRAPNENPRRGLRLEPGTLMIQGHDPTTDLEFRKLQITEFPEEK
ncbi:3-keto-disaccharide hydrolase [Bythopirellula polymerisocia]|uniref:3-keto-alpha-glucoside-1,2-lyase/3-keto-2-hydroxy-glucal hydratase domain-containing protein n=1 Tax=Bythopirellula polymerisocia TaxID=2528003 RepID=A0A5C6C8G5_9BACT|nr:DUF1080 domain-containing protein [Bythopirellula polymerisocia]TWU20385.1 hypothetical protein Pla144_49600 [Bythopirellula polymerisocia]